VANESGRVAASEASFERIGRRKVSVLPEPVPVVTATLVLPDAVRSRASA
jgi:hypothetical protein